MAIIEKEHNVIHKIRSR